MYMWVYDTLAGKSVLPNGVSVLGTARLWLLDRLVQCEYVRVDLASSGNLSPSVLCKTLFCAGYVDSQQSIRNSDRHGTSCR